MSESLHLVKCPPSPFMLLQMALFHSFFYDWVIFHCGLLWWLRWWRICLQFGRHDFDPWVGKIPWQRAWQPAPVFLPREFPWIEEPGRLQSMGSQRVRHDWVTKHSTAQYSTEYFTISFNLKTALHWWVSLLSPFIHREIKVLGNTANGNRVDIWTWHFWLLCWVLCASPETVIVSIILCLLAYSLNKHEHLGSSAWSIPPPDPVQ